MSDMMEKLKEMSRLMKAQDNRCTADPFFVVQEKRRTYGIRTDYTDNIEWIDDDECLPVESKLARKLEKKYQVDSDESPQGYRRVGHREEWHYVQGFFTEAAADRYIKENGHNHHELRVYVEGLFRNHEMIALRNWILSLTDEPKE